MAFLAHSNATRGIRSPTRTAAGSGLLLQCLIYLSLASTTFAQQIEAPEPRVKTAFLYNFTKLVTWPTNAFADSNAPIVIGVLGRDTLGEELDRIEGRIVSGRPIHVERYASAESVTNCQVLFITDSERRKLDSIFNELQGRPILTVGESRGFASQGVIELVKTNDNLNLRINLEAANEAGLTLSSRLMRLDRTLRPPDPRSETPAPKEAP